MLEHYRNLADLRRFLPAITRADAVIVGSYVPEGAAVIDTIAAAGPLMLCFYDVDTPVTLARLAAGEEDHLAGRQVPLFDIYFSFSGGPVLRRLETRHGARRAEALYCSADPEHYRATGEPLRWDLGYLGTYSPDRHPALERLLLEPARRLPRHRFVVAGAQYPADLAWPANVELIEHLPPADHASFYSRQRFTLNVTRHDMVVSGWSPSVRLFEAGACATPVISDAWSGLDTFFEDGDAILVANTSADMIHILTTTTEAKRTSIAQAARARVLARHTGRARARELLDHLEQFRSGLNQSADSEIARVQKASAVAMSPMRTETALGASPALQPARRSG